MFDVEATQKALREPAQSLEELAERLYLLIGRTLRVKIRPVVNYYGANENGYTIAGNLDSVVLADGNREIASIYLGSSSSNSSQQRNILLSSDIRVLTDGQWVSVHCPEGN